MSGNDAHGKQPTIEEEMSKFKGFSVKDGEVDKGDPTADENAAALVNRSSHADNVKRGAAPPTAKEEKAPVELTDEESEAAVAAAQEAAGDEELSDKDKEEALAAALAEKTKTAAKPPKDKSPAARIAAARRLQGNADRRATALEAENAELRAKLLKGGSDKTPLTAETKNERVPVPGKPDPSDTKKYEYGELDAKYLADLT